MARPPSRSDALAEPGPQAFSRRAALGALLLPLAGAACRRRPYDARAFTRPARSAVALLPAASYEADLVDLIARGLRDLGVDVRGRRVLLKPNLVEYEIGTAINTHPAMIAAAAIAFRRAGAGAVVVAEGPGHRRDVEYLLTATRLYDHLRDARVRFVDLNHDDVQWVKLRSRFMQLEELALPVEVLRSDFIVSMPKLKTHHWAGLTCSMKNFFGVVPGAVYGWPKNLLHQRGIPQAIVDLVATVRPHFAIVDGIVGMEGDGPIMGRPRPVGMIAMGADVVAVDATCARIMGFDPARVPYLRAAGEFLGNLEAPAIELRGEPLARFAAPFDVLDYWKHLRPDAAEQG